MKRTLFVIFKIILGTIIGYLVWFATMMIGAKAVACYSLGSILQPMCMYLVGGFPFHGLGLINLAFWIIISYIIVELLFFAVRKLRHRG